MTALAPNLLWGSNHSTGFDLQSHMRLRTSVPQWPPLLTWTKPEPVIIIWVPSLWAPSMGCLEAGNTITGLSSGGSHLWIARGHVWHHLYPFSSTRPTFLSLPWLLVLNLKSGIAASFSGVGPEVLPFTSVLLGFLLLLFLMGFNVCCYGLPCKKSD